MYAHAVEMTDRAMAMRVRAQGMGVRLATFRRKRLTRGRRQRPLDGLNHEHLELLRRGRGL